MREEAGSNNKVFGMSPALQGHASAPSTLRRAVPLRKDRQDSLARSVSGTGAPSSFMLIARSVQLGIRFTELLDTGIRQASPKTDKDLVPHNSRRRVKINEDKRNNRLTSAAVCIKQPLYNVFVLSLSEAASMFRNPLVKYGSSNTCSMDVEHFLKSSIHGFPGLRMCL